MTATIAVLGDLHFGHVDPAACAALTRDLRTDAPELVVIAGDLTQRARTREFRNARRFIDGLVSPTLVIPGNHDLPLFDLPRRLIQPYGRYRRHIAQDLEPEIALPALAAIGVDATRRLRHKHGVLGPRTIARAADRLRRLRRPFRIVAVHQPLAALHADDDHHVARGAERALESWLAAGADLIVGGHVHRGYFLQVGTSPTGIVVQTGTAISTRLRHSTPNSYFRVQLLADAEGGRRMRILRRDHDAARGLFETRQQGLAVHEAGGWRLIDEGLN